MFSPSFTLAETARPTTFRRLLQSPVPMWIFDRTTLQILEVNEAATELYGYSRDEFLRMTILDFRPLEDIPEVLKIALRAPGREEDVGVWNHRKKMARCFKRKSPAGRLLFRGRKQRWCCPEAVRSASAQN